MKQAYIPDIAKFGSLCESNYVRLCKLIGSFEEGDEQGFGLSNHHQTLGQIRIRVLESSRYTNLVLLEQVQATGKWLNNPQLTVRIYHDARMAEVVSAVNHPRVMAVNEYPNAKMHLPDEKLQLNQFLAEWLSFCLSHGHAESHTPPLPF